MSASTTWRRGVTRVLAAVLAGGATTTAPGQTGCEGWRLERSGRGWWNAPGAHSGPLRASAMRVFDIDGDGPGLPVLVAGAQLSSGSGSTVTNALCIWDGRAWGPMHAGLAGPTGASVVATWLCEHDFDGPGPEPSRLIVTGDRLGFDPVAESGFNVGWWDGTRWRALHSREVVSLGGTGTVWQAASFDADGPGPELPKLVACGYFDQEIAGQTVRNIATWEGGMWRPLGAGLQSVAHTVRAYDPDGPGPATPVLVAGGEFTLAGGLAASRIAMWDGAQWSPMGAGLNGTVFALFEFDFDGPGPESAQLLAGGSFTFSGASSYVARWDGAQWQPLSGTAVGRAVAGLNAHDPDGPGPLSPVLVAATGSAPGSTNGVFRYGPGGWERIAETQDWVDTVVSFDPDADGLELPRLIASGYIRRIETLAGEIEPGCFVSWDGSDWSPLGPSLTWTSGTTSGVHAAVEFDADGDGPGEPAIVVGGQLRNAGWGAANHLAQWTVEGGWAPVGLGVGPASSTITRVHALASLDEDGDGPGPAKLIIGGNFSTAGGVAAQHIASWDGLTWTAMPGLTSAVTELLPHEPIEGGPQQVIAVSNNLVYRWTGSAWTRLGTGTSTLATVSCLAEYPLAGPGSPRELLVGASAGVHRWTGTAWSALGVLGRPVYAMMPFDVDGALPGPVRLVIAASTLSGSAVKPLMYWSGAGWIAIHEGLSGDASGLAVVHRGGEPVLVALGVLKAPGWAEYSRIVGWDGSAWTDEAHGMDVITAANVLLAERVTAPDAAMETLLIGGNGVRVPDSGTPTGSIGAVQRWMANPPPVMVREPRMQAPRPGQTAVFEIEARAEPARELAYRWFRGEEPLSDGPTGAGGAIAGAASPRLEITNPGRSDEGEYRCVISTECGSVSSLKARLMMRCPADLVPDGVVDFTDYLEFLTLFDAMDARADLDGDGLVDLSDYLAFLNSFDAGC